MFVLSVCAGVCVSLRCLFVFACVVFFLCVCSLLTPSDSVLSVQVWNWYEVEKALNLVPATVVHKHAHGDRSAASLSPLYASSAFDA